VVCKEHAKLVDDIKDNLVKAEHRLTRLEFLVIFLGLGSMFESVALKLGCPWYIDIAIFTVIIVFIMLIILVYFKNLNKKYSQKLKSTRKEGGK
jgi:membrane protein implicated in regulation of membrane protease activity